jgi:hypothetical protein
MITAIYFGIVLISLFVSAQQQSLTSDEFKAIINKSRQDCLTGRQTKANETRYDHGDCGADTIDTMYNKIPGNKSTVNLYASYELKRTFELCSSRDDKNGNDWNTMLANRYKLGASAYTGVWTDCQKQIDKERADCKNAKNVLCAFKRGTAFECVPDQQKKRTCTTLEQGDECYAVEALVDGRPKNVTDFNSRVAASRRQCIDPSQKQQADQYNQFVNTNCNADRRISMLLTRFPPGMTKDQVLAQAYPQPGLRETVAMCINREQVGFTPITARAWTAPFATDRTACLAQLTKEQDDCKTAQHLICAFSFGVDFSCWKQELKSRQGIQQHDACERIVSDVITNPIG